MSENKLIKAIKEKGQTMEAEMSFFDHLEALRWHLVRAAIAIVIFTIGAFYFYDFIFDTVIMGPSRPDFWTYRMLCKLGAYLHRDGFCISKINISCLNTEMAGQFTLQINSALLIGITLGFPYLLWELWRFIKPALHEKEQKAARGFVMYATFLFLSAYYLAIMLLRPSP
jgi:sec-independent protein translocase protein TatC